MIPSQFDYRGGWTMVKAERLDPDAILAALKAGHFYASTGPELKADAERIRAVLREIDRRILHAAAARDGRSDRDAGDRRVRADRQAVPRRAYQIEPVLRRIRERGGDDDP